MCVHFKIKYLFIVIIFYNTLIFGQADSLLHIDACNIKKYVGIKISTSFIYSGIYEYWSLHPTNHCGKDSLEPINADFKIFDSNPYYNQYHSLFDSLYNGWYKGAIIEVEGVLDTGKEYGHLGSYKYNFTIHRILNFKPIPTTPELFYNNGDCSWLVLSNVDKNELENYLMNHNTIKKITINNYESDELPVKIFDMTNLVGIYINGKLKYLNEKIEKLKKLEILDLCFCEVSTLPDNITNLPNLRELDIRNGLLEHLPHEIGKLKNLERIDTRDSKLKVLPESISELANLKLLMIGHCELQSLPEYIGNLTNLETLWIEGNKIMELPNSIGNLRKLKDFSIWGNKLKNVPESIKNLNSCLKRLILFNNEFTSEELNKIKLELPNVEVR